ncbi:MAG: hypothetical protein QOJ15_1502 [Bradyrhizobium sp.]|nr:hypothetical protein [Bradyrhizobium sp.]
MDFNDTYTQLQTEKDERQREAANRARESTKQAHAIHSGLSQFILARSVGRAGVDFEPPATLIVKKGGESLKLAVTEPGRFAVKRFVGDYFKPLDGVSEDEMKRAIVQWLCPEVDEIGG